MNRAPLIVGTIAILGLAITLCYRSPSPGPLSRAHATDVASLPTCEACHAEGGLTAGCLSCHAEIAEQLREKQGLHHPLTSDGPAHCEQCHPEHHGASFDIMEAVAWGAEKRKDFQHDHVDFTLVDAHRELGCEACHKAVFAMPGYAHKPRRKTFLGLSQTCTECHENVHGSEELGDCLQCHGQTAFKPAVGFDHDAHFPLTGGHAAVECKACHVSSGELSFKDVRGTSCAECHESPHRTDWGKKCEDCHDADAAAWSTAASDFPPALHAQSGFALEHPHDKQDCGACHTSGLAYSDRFRKPARAANDCRACHADVHAGQFSERHDSCRDCHAKTHFQPSEFGLDRHTSFPLSGAHAAAECRACHRKEDGVQRFVGTPRRCADCHEDVHAGQFEDSCSTCHTEERFRPSTIGLAEHSSFALKGAHATASCDACHTLDPHGVRRFRDTPRSCSACHDDPHAGQFKSACSDCHNERSFRPSGFGRAEHSSFPLEGAHDAVACIACHKAGPTGVRKFVGTPTKCSACHENPHGEQFTTTPSVTDDCTACHEAGSSSFAIRPFDHKARTGYALLGGHAKARCDQCHRSPKPGQPRRYRSTPKDCASCHADEHRGQFKGRDCRTCHASTHAWPIRRFDHSKTRFPLDGQHQRVSCSGCHAAVKQRDGKLVVHYRPIGTSCKDCHEIHK